MAYDYTTDVSMTIEEWRQLVSFMSATNSYSDRGKGTQTWATSTRAMSDIQPVSVQDRADMEENGVKKAATHVFNCYYNTTGVKISTAVGKRVKDASGNIYEIVYIKDWSGSHLEVFALYVEGKKV